MPWYYNFMKRWPELHNVKSQSLSELRARAASKDSIDNYYIELDRILTLYNLKDKPHCIHNVDEKAVMIGAGKVPYIVAPKAQTVTSERGQNVTAVGCGNAAGASIPPYLVFPGKRMLPELLKDATPGCDGSVSSTGKGYSNTDIFSTYVKSHFFKYVQGRDPDQHVLLMYDGHRSHISLSLIEWAKQNKIILFVLPPPTSHILQPMDVGFFGPFEVLYQAEVKKITRQKSGTSVTRYDIWGLVCKVYDKALQGDNLRAAFRRTGIYPLKKLLCQKINWCRAWCSKDGQTKLKMRPKMKIHKLVFHQFLSSKKLVISCRKKVGMFSRQRNLVEISARLWQAKLLLKMRYLKRFRNTKVLVTNQNQNLPKSSSRPNVILKQLKNNLVLKVKLKDQFVYRVMTDRSPVYQV